MRLVGIASRQQRGGPMRTHPSAMITRVAGLEYDGRGKPGNRQVTLLSVQQWQLTCAAIGQARPWTDRRANLLVDGLAFSASFLNKQIKIGQLILYVTGETDPCNKMDNIHLGLQQALHPDWRGGVCCKVLADGRVHLNDPITVI